MQVSSYEHNSYPNRYISLKAGFHLSTLKGLSAEEKSQEKMKKKKKKKGGGRREDSKKRE